MNEPSRRNVHGTRLPDRWATPKPTTPQRTLDEHMQLWHPEITRVEARPLNSAGFVRVTRVELAVEGTDADDRVEPFTIRVTHEDLLNIADMLVAETEPVGGVYSWHW